MYNKKVLVIAGGLWQVPLIKYLKSKSYIVYVADPYDTSPGVLIADHHVKADVRNAGLILELIANIKFDFITSDQTDIAVETVVYLSGKMGLKCNKPEAVKKFTNKYFSRNYAREIGVPTPAYHIANSLDEARELINSSAYDVIIKPVDSQSSRGIFMFHKGDDIIEAAIVECFKESRETYILVEEFFVGTEYTVEGICSAGKHKTLAISEKKHFRTGIASDLEYPAILPAEIENELIRVNDLYVENSGLDFGITHAEYIINKTSQKIALVEIACRGGGTLISSDIAGWVSGVNVYDILISELGENKPTDVKEINALKRSAILHFFEYPNGRIDSISGVEEILRIPGVIRFNLEFKVGDVIKAARDDRSRQGFVIIFAEDAAELLQRLNLVKDALKIKITNV